MFIRSFACVSARWTTAAVRAPMRRGRRDTLSKHHLSSRFNSVSSMPLLSTNLASSSRRRRTRRSYATHIGVKNFNFAPRACSNAIVSRRRTPKTRLSSARSKTVKKNRIMLKFCPRESRIRYHAPSRFVPSSASSLLKLGSPSRSRRFLVG